MKFARFTRRRWRDGAGEANQAQAGEGRAATRANLRRLSSSTSAPIAWTTPSSSGQTRKWMRLTVFAIAGMLIDMEGSVLEKDDVDLLHQVAYVADTYAGALAQSPEETP